MRRAETLWAAAFLALLAVAYGLLPAPRALDRADSFTTDGGGKLAFYRLASGLLPRVERSTGALIPEAGDADTLVLLGPARYPDRAQWQTLHDWVVQGHALVFAGRWQDPAVELTPFGIEIAPLSSPGNEGAEATAEGERTPFERAIETELVEDVPAWRTLGEVRFTSNEVSVVLWLDDRPQVIWQPVGDGAIVVASSDYVFSNASLARDENGLLAFRILELASPTGPVYFDEQMNQAGAPKVVGILFEEPFRKLTLQLLLLAVLLGWMASVRFGPRAEDGAPARRSLVEHAEALGSLHFRAGSGGRLVGAYLEFFRRDLSVREPRIDARASAAPATPTLVERAVRAAKSPRLEPSRVGELVRSLASSRRSSS